MIQTAESDKILACIDLARVRTVLCLLPLLLAPPPCVPAQWPVDVSYVVCVSWVALFCRWGRSN